MKKIAVIVLTVFLFIPFISASAETVDLLDGKVLKPLHVDVKNINLATDNDATTFSDFGYYGGGNPTLKASYTFDTPVDVTGLRLKGSTFTVTFLDAYGGVIKNQAATTDILYEFNANGVKEIKIYAMNSNTNKLYELEVFGIGTLPINYLPVSNLSESHTYSTVNLSWVNPNVKELTGVVIEKDGLEIVTLPSSTTSYQVGSLSAETSYNFKVYSTYSDGTRSEGKTISVITDVKPLDTTAPTNISNVSVVKTHESANFLYALPVDTDFSHLEVFRDGTLIENNLKDTTFHDYGLVANTSYVYKFVSVDIDGNKSTGFVQTVLTDSETDSLAPDVPKGLSGINANASGRVSWSRNNESDISGYNLYVNGVKYNTSLILASNYVINGLQNGTSYSITVSAVDTSGNESGQSSPVALNPSESEMPIFSSKFDLKDVADGTNNWFMSLWPILAFSVGITLAFIVARRVKLLFFA